MAKTSHHGGIGASYFNYIVDRIILSRLKKIKKNIDKSKIIFFGSGFGYQWEVGPFFERH